MTINKKKMNVTNVHLSPYEMDSLCDAMKTLDILFKHLTAKDNITHVASIMSDLGSLIEELNENENSIIEFMEDK